MNLRISKAMVAFLVLIDIFFLGCPSDKTATMTYPRSGYTYELPNVWHQVEFHPPAQGAGLEAEGPAGDYAYSTIELNADNQIYEHHANFKLRYAGTWDSRGGGQWFENGDIVESGDEAEWYAVSRFASKPTSIPTQPVIDADLVDIRAQYSEGVTEIGGTITTRSSTFEDFKVALSKLSPSYLHKGMNKYDANLKTYGDNVMKVAIKNRLPNLSNDDIDTLKLLAEQKIFGHAKNFNLGENFPEPFNPQTVIPYSITGNLAQAVSLQILNVQGQIIRDLVNKEQGPGKYQISCFTFLVNGKDESGRVVSSGTYFYTLRVGGFSESRKMLLIK